MFKWIRISCVALFYLSIPSLSAQEPVSSSVKKKYNLSVCAIFRNEAKYLKEWIEYHRLIGVDHFYLYNNGSLDNYLKMLRQYIQEGTVTLIHWPNLTSNESDEAAYMWSLSTQIPAYENATKLRAIHETKWLVFVDINEFLVPAHTSSLTELLDKYELYPGVTLLSDFFDASRTHTFPQRKLIIETLELTNQPRMNVQKSVTKTIFKPDQCTGFTWPPYHCIFQNQQEALTLKKREFRINHYTNRFKGFLHFSKTKEKLHVDNRLLSEDETAELLENDYEIEDQDRVIYRFLPELRKKMGLDHGWNHL